MDFEHVSPEAYGAFWDFLKPKAKSSESMPVLQSGSSGLEVEQLQMLLDIPVDGDFGVSTLKAVKAFQQANKLQITGVVDQPTWAVLLGEKKGIQVSPDTVNSIGQAAGQLVGMFQKPANSDVLLAPPVDNTPDTTGTSWSTYAIAGGVILGMGIGGFFLYKYATKE